MVPWRTIFFAVNFAAAVLVVLSCVAAIIEVYFGGRSPYSFAGGVCFVWPALAFGVSEWFLHVRSVRALERPLGIACGVVGSLVIFGFVSNAVEAISKGQAMSVGLLFWLGFGGVCVAIAAYAFWC